MEFVYFVIGCIVGAVLAVKWHTGGKKEQYARVWIQDGSNHAIILYSLYVDRVRALAERIKAGRPFRYKTLVGKGKLLRRSEWDKFTRECVQRGILQQSPNKIYSPTPLGEKFFENLGTPHARTRQNPHNRGII